MGTETDILRIKLIPDGEGRVRASLVGVEKQTEKVGGAARKASKGFSALTRAVGAVAVGALVLRGITSVVSIGAQFEQSMANVASVAGATKEQLVELSRAARDQAKVSIFSATQAAEAQYFLASAGLSVTQIMRAQRGVMALAAATQSDLAKTAAITTATLSQFGLRAEESTRVANVFAAAIAGSQATMQKLGDAMRQAGPAANALGIDIESTTAAISLLFNAGFKGEQAGTILRASMIQLQKPAAEAAALIKRMGLEVNDAAGKFVGFESLIKQLEKSQLNLNKAATLFGTEAAAGMLAIVNQGSVAFADMRDKITDTNKAMELAEQQVDTLTGDWKLFKSALEETAITIFDVFNPALRSITKEATRMLSWLNRSELQVLEEAKATQVVLLQSFKEGFSVFDSLTKRRIGLITDEIHRLDALIIKKNQEIVAREAASAADQEKLDGGRPDTGGGGISDQAQQEIERVRQSLKTKEELLTESFNRRREIVLNNMAEGVERNQLLEDLEAQHQQKLTEINRKEASNRQAIEKRVQASIMSMKLAVAQQAIGLVRQLAGDNKAVAITLLAVEKGLAIAQVVINTQVASMRALAELGPIAGGAAAAKIQTLGQWSIGLIAATGLAEAANIGSAPSVGGGSGGVGGGYPAAGSETMPLPESTQSGSIVQVIVQGNFYGNEEALEQFAASLKDQIENGDLVIISSDSRQAQEIVAAA